MSVKLRQQMERKIARRIILDAKKMGYQINVNNGGDTNELPAPTTHLKLLLDTMFATDEEHLLFYKDGKRVGWIFLIYGNGNDGLDVVSDYSTTLDALMDPIFKWLEKYN